MGAAPLAALTIAARIPNSLFGLTGMQQGLPVVLESDTFQPQELFLEYGTDVNATVLVMELINGLR